MHDVLTAPLKAIRIKAAADGTDYKQHAVRLLEQLGNTIPAMFPQGSRCILEYDCKSLKHHSAPLAQLDRASDF